MSKIKTNLHMSIQPEKGNILPPLQKRIIIFLAKNQPQTKNEIVKHMNGSQKSYWIAIQSLKEKKLIQTISLKTYRGNEYEQIWTSPAGVLIALFEGENPKTLLENSINVYPQDTNLHTIIELSQVLGTKAFEVAFYTYLRKGKLEESDLTMILFSLMEEDLDSNSIEPLSEFLNKHPQQLEASKNSLKKITKIVDKIDSILKECENDKPDVRTDN